MIASENWTPRSPLFVHVRYSFLLYSESAPEKIYQYLLENNEIKFCKMGSVLGSEY